MKNVKQYLNPIARLGSGEYAYFFPLLATIIYCIISVIIMFGLSNNLAIAARYILFLNVAVVIYFSFRDGIIGGIIATAVIILFSFYILITRHYPLGELSSLENALVMLSISYLLIAIIIGWLKQTIDSLIERETYEKIWLQTILQQLAVGVVIADNNGKIVLANKQLGKILGTKFPRGFVFGKDTYPVSVYENNKPTLPAHSPLHEALAKGKTIGGREFSIVRKDGSNVTIQVNSSVIKNKKRKIVAAASILTDISQQKELEKQKDQFLSMASHELKTPITSLKMFIDLQSQQLKVNNTTKAKYFNERIATQAERLKELSDDLLDVSRIQTNKLRFKIEEFDIADVIRDTVEGTQATAKDRKILIKEEKHFSVRADRFRIYQVILNLLSNAIKYSPKSKKIVIRTKKAKNKVVVSVQDFGIGISKVQQEKIFERLYQESDSKENTFPGFGLGLYICKEIIDRHKGEIWVDSVKGEGATFFFSLPIYVPSRQ